jgi:hypothetical protein
MKTVEAIIAWAHSFGIGGAFFVLALAGFGLCALALLVALAALKRHRS